MQKNSKTPLFVALITTAVVMLMGGQQASCFGHSTPAMNKDAASGGLYKIANPPPGKSPYVDASLHAHRGKFIEVYSQNISTQYSEVHWTMHPPVALPADFVAKYNGKVVALTGYEADTMRVLADGREEHVPLYDQYNHHHCAYVHGAQSKLVDVGPAGSARTVDGHGAYQGRWEARATPLTTVQQKAGADPEQLPMAEIPTGAFLVDGNGGEFRMSLHGTAAGSAMLVQSPSTFQVQPMMINTHNPNGKGPGHWDLFPSGAYRLFACRRHRMYVQTPRRALATSLGSDTSLLFSCNRCVWRSRLFVPHGARALALLPSA